MPKSKPARTRPSLDMTPMVDLAFLLVTFFMLTTKFRPEDPVEVDTPSSISDVIIPDRDVLELTIDPKGRVFLGVDNKNTRGVALDNMVTTYGKGQIQFSEQQKGTFSVLSSFGVSFSQLPQYLDLSSEQRKKVETAGIPYDTSANSELAYWIDAARYANPALRIAIKGDGDASLPAVRNLIATLQSKNIDKFSLVTDLEENPNKRK